MTIVIKGDVAAVQTAIAGKATVERWEAADPRRRHPRPHPELAAALLPG
jgi:microcompartment protein CcmL/EutN